jgi:hypothetical protein
MKPRRNEEAQAQAHIGLSSHKKTVKAKWVSLPYYILLLVQLQQFLSELPLYITSNSDLDFFISIFLIFASFNYFSSFFKFLENS